MTTVSGVAHTDIPRSEIKTTKYFTDAKIQKIAIVAFATLTALGGVGLVAMSLAGIITLPFAPLACTGAIALCCASAGLIYWACSIKDYENPKELQKMREKAQLLSYPELVQEYGLQNIAKYRIISPERLEAKRQFHESLQLIDAKYANRQEVLLHQLHRARKEIQGKGVSDTWSVMHTGFAATSLATGLQRNANDRQSAQLIGLGATGLATAAAPLLFGQLYKGDLQRIANEEARIIREGIGQKEQAAYIQETAEARRAHEQMMAALPIS